MPSRLLNAVVQQLRDADGPTDGELLTGFLNRGDGDALAALVERHAPMVWGVCRRVLHNSQDAEDAFQATFLVLVTKAAAVAPRERVANWLHGVARQTAVRLRATAAKRGWREVQMNAMPEPAGADARDGELLARLDEELARLPERFRALIVLCDLEGHTRKEAARQLGCPEGTVASGLARARELLAKRLIRRGLAVSGGSLAATLSHSVASADVPPAVVNSTVNVATLLATGKAAGAISGPVATLTHEVLKIMFLKKILTAVAVLAVVAVAGMTGYGVVLGQQRGDPAAPQKPASEKAGSAGVKGEAEKKDATAWGEEVDGLQMGLVPVPADAPTVRQGEKLKLTVKLRNAGKAGVTVTCGVLRECAPLVATDTGGRVVTYMPPPIDNLAVPIKRTLEPGETITLYNPEVAVESEDRAKPEGEVRVAAPTIFVKPGKYKIAYYGTIRSHPKLATGKLEIEVEAGLPQPKVDKPPHVVEKVDMTGRMASGLPHKPGGEPTEESIRVVTKWFFSKMGTYPDHRFREFFDPRYLKKHGLTDREIAFEVVGDYRGIHNYVVADDNRTVLCTLLRTVDGKEVREFFLLRWVFHDGCLYVSPEKAPDPKTGIFTPWILRQKP